MTEHKTEDYPIDLVHRKTRRPMLVQVPATSFTDACEKATSLYPNHDWTVLEERDQVTDMYMVQLRHRKGTEIRWERVPGTSLKDACARAERLHQGYVWTMATTL